MKNLAKAILLSMDIRENSYDHEAADLASEEYQVKQVLAHENKYVFMPDYGQFYTKTIEQSVSEACEQCGLESIDNTIVMGLVYNSWNDAEDWARAKLGLPKEEVS